jgi:hypothetical protein
MDKMRIRNHMLADLENPAAVNAYLQILLRTGGKPTIYSAKFAVWRRKGPGLYEVRVNSQSITRRTSLLNILGDIQEYYDNEISEYYDDNFGLPFIDEIENELGKAKIDIGVIDSLVSSLEAWLNAQEAGDRYEVDHHISWNDEEHLDF